MSGCQLQRELRNAAAARDVHKEALDLAQQGLTQLEDALAKEQAIHQDSVRKVGALHSVLMQPHSALPPLYHH